MQGRRGWSLTKLLWRCLMLAGRSSTDVAQRGCSCMCRVQRAPPLPRARPLLCPAGSLSCHPRVTSTAAPPIRAVPGALSSIRRQSIPRVLSLVRGGRTLPRPVSHALRVTTPARARSRPSAPRAAQDSERRSKVRGAGKFRGAAFAVRVSLEKKAEEVDEEEPFATAQADDSDDEYDAELEYDRTFGMGFS